MLRKTAIILYALGILIAMLFMGASLSGNAHLSWEWRTDHVVYAFIPMVLFMCIALYGQLKSLEILWPLVVLVVIASVSLFYSSLFHMYPDKSKLIALIHLAIVIVGSGWVFFQSRKLKNAL